MEHAITVWNTLFTFFSNYGIQSLLGISVLANIYLVIAWVRRERFIEMTEIEVSLLKPRIKFELNHDEKYKFMSNEIIKLRNEIDLLKKDHRIPVIIIILMVIVAQFSSWSLNRSGKKQKLLEANNESLLSQLNDTNRNNEDLKEQLDLYKQAIKEKHPDTARDLGLE